MIDSPTSQTSSLKLSPDTTTFKDLPTIQPIVATGSEPFEIIRFNMKHNSLGVKLTSYFVCYVNKTKGGAGVPPNAVAK